MVLLHLNQHCLYCAHLTNLVESIRMYALGLVVVTQKYN